MNLNLFGLLLAISIVLIVLGLTRPKESAHALIGFTFLFLLSFIIINGNLQYETGANVTATYTYDGSGNVIGTTQQVLYSYDDFNDSTSHKIGIYLAIASVIGFLGVIFGLTGGLRREK